MRFMLAISVAALLGACQSTNGYVSPYDTEAMARVEKAALAAGVKVIWLHPPTKKTN